MAESLYNNTKNISTYYTLFELNCGFYLQVLFKEDVNFHLKSCSTNKLAEKLKKLIKICYQNLVHIQELQKKAQDKKIKNCSYALGNKVC